MSLSRSTLKEQPFAFDLRHRGWTSSATKNQRYKVAKQGDHRPCPRLICPSTIKICNWQSLNNDQKMFSVMRRASLILIKSPLKFFQNQERRKNKRLKLRKVFKIILKMSGMIWAMVLAAILNKSAKLLKGLTGNQNKRWKSKRSTIWSKTNR